MHNRGLTIHAVPHHIIAGEAVLIFGQLKGPDHANQVIPLYHRINPNPGFSLIGVTKTNATGQYEFTRQEGIVDTNRSWFVRGPGMTHSRTVHERVAALVSLAASSTSGLTRHPIVFSGHVTPDHAGSVVALQEQKGSSDDWRTIGPPVSGPVPTTPSPMPGGFPARTTSGSCSAVTRATSRRPQTSRRS